MAVSRRIAAVLLAGIPLVVAGLGCASQPKARELPPQSMAQEAPEPVSEEPPPPPERDEPVAAPGADPNLVVVEEPPASTQPNSLYEAAMAERERRQQTGAPVASITNENLAEYSGGNLTYSEGSASDEPAADSDAEDLLPSEDFWRERVRNARQAWRDSYDAIEELEGEVAGLRNRFYAEDDPYYRDRQIKPAWDRALDRLAQAQSDVVMNQREVERILEEGRRAGALPGWLREGMELVPPRESWAEPTLDPATDEVESIEPVVVDEDGQR